MEIFPLIRGTCPVCEKIIMNDKRTVYINGGMDFWVRFDDGTNAQFGICEDCYKVITQEQLDEIMRRQIVNWGLDIAEQLQWFYKKAVFLKIIKHAKEKDGL